MEGVQRAEDGASDPGRQGAIGASGSNHLHARLQAGRQAGRQAGSVCVSFLCAYELRAEETRQSLKVVNKAMVEGGMFYHQVRDLGTPLCGNRTLATD